MIWNIAILQGLHIATDTIYFMDPEETYQRAMGM